MRIVYIDIDSLRPDHLGCYGYDAPTSPAIDRFAGDAVRFDRMYAANSPCMPSRAGFLSGRYGVHNGVVTHGPQAQVIDTPHSRSELAGDREEWFTLPEVFFENHVPTVAVSSFPRHPAPWFYHVWDEFYHPREPEESVHGFPEYFQTPRAEVVADRAIACLDDLANEEAYFCYIQLWDPHLPYNRSEEEVEAFRETTPTPPYPTDDAIGDHAEWDAVHNLASITDMVPPGVDPPETEHEQLHDLLARYDAEIRYADTHVGRILDHLRALDQYEDTLIVLTADHGEEFGEHGVYACHWSVFEGTQRVPLLIKPPGGASGGHGRDELVTNVDLPSTILDYADRVPPETWQGESLRPLLQDEDPHWRDGVVLEHGYVSVQRAMRSGPWKLIHTLHPGMWPSVLDEFELYHVDSDPWEQTDVAPEHPDVVESLSTEMNEWVAEHGNSRDDPLKVVAEVGPGLYLDHVDNHAGV